MGKTRNSLRTRRLQAYLSQEELAFLFGYSDDSIISRLEHQHRAITLDVAYACRVLFGQGARDIFPSVYEDAKARISDRIVRLRDRLQQKRPSGKNLAKLQFLEEALSRAQNSKQERV